MPRKAKPSRKPPRPVLPCFIAAYRERVGMEKQEDLADVVGVSQELISKYEAGKQPISPDKLFLIAEALGLAHPLMVYSDPDQPSLDLLVTDLPEEDREEIIELINMKRRRRLAN